MVFILKIFKLKYNFLTCDFSSLCNAPRFTTRFDCLKALAPGIVISIGQRTKKPALFVFSLVKSHVSIPAFLKRPPQQKKASVRFNGNMPLLPVLDAHGMYLCEGLCY